MGVADVRWSVLYCIDEAQINVRNYIHRRYDALLHTTLGTSLPEPATVMVLLDASSPVVVQYVADPQQTEAVAPIIPCSGNPKCVSVITQAPAHIPHTAHFSTQPDIPPHAHIQDDSPPATSERG